MGTFCTVCSNSENEKEKSLSNTTIIKKKVEYSYSYYYKTTDYNLKNEMYYKKRNDYDNNIAPFLKIKRSVSLRDSKSYQNGNVSVINI